MDIENDLGLSALLPSDGPAVVSGGYTFTEGPVWLATEGALIFSDIPTGTARRFQPGDPASTLAPVWRTQTRGGNGMTLDNDGNIVCCEQSSRRVVRFPVADPEAIEVIAEDYRGARLNSPNDVVVDSHGRVYFTDPSYGLGPGGEGRELPHNGVYRIDTDGAIHLIDDRFQQPNGLVFSPDERYLYIGDTQQLVIRRFEVQPDGTIIGGAVFADMRKATQKGGPDGMTIDADGRLWATGPGGIWLIDADGTPLGQLLMPEQPSNVTFGGPDGTTLYITAETSLYQLDTTVTGVIPAGVTAVGAGPAR